MLTVLVERDPLELADPEITLEDEYEAEAREIARRVLVRQRVKAISSR